MADINEIVSQAALQSVKNTIDAIAKLNLKLDETLKTSVALGEKLGKSSGFTKNTEAAKQNKTAISEVEKINRQLAATEEKLAAVSSKANQELIKKKTALQQETKAIKDSQKAAQAAKGSYNQLNEALKRDIASLKAMSAAELKTSKTAKQLKKSIEDNQRALKKMDKEMGNHQRNVGNYTKKLQGLGKQFVGALGLTGLVYGFVRALKSAISVNIEFNKSLASLSAITGLTGKDLAFFGDEAKRISKITLQSANDMLKAFERIGSIRPELLLAKEALVEVTEAAVILSESTGGMLSLEDAANATAGVMNQLGISSGEAYRTINTLAAGSKYGSSTTQDLAEAFKSFGAVANQSNISLEESVGLVELAATKMIVGSEAGTAIRNSILSLQKANIGYASGQFNVNDAIDEFNTQLNSFGTQAEKDSFILDTFGNRGITFGTILVSNKDKFNELTDAVTGTTTALDQQATQNDTLAGSLSRLGNAWTSFITGSSATAKFFQEVLDGWSELLNGKASFWDWFLYGEAKLSEAEKDAEKVTGALKNMTSDEIKSGLDQLRISYNNFLQSGASDEFLQGIKDRIAMYDEEIARREKLANVPPPVTPPGGGGGDGDAGGGGDGDAGGGRVVLEQMQSIGNAQVEIQADTHEQLLEGQREYADASFEIAENLEEGKKALRDAEIQAVLNGLEIISLGYQTQINSLENQKQYELSLVEGNETKKAEIEEKYNKKQNEARRKQAIADKTAAIFQAAINTAVSIVKTGATLGYPLAIPFQVLAAALGIAQIAVIASQPVPQFAEGTDSSPEGMAIVGEKGRELLIDPSGGISLSADRPEKRYLKRGTKVIPNMETSQILNAAKGHDSYEMMVIADAIRQGDKDIVRAIKNKRELTIIPGKAKIRERNGRYYTTYENAKFTQ